MHARDLMSTDTVITVPPEAPVHLLAQIMAERGVTGLPVVDQTGRLHGLVTETDLLHRLAATDERPHGYLWGLFHSAEAQARHYARSHGRQARDVMSTELATATEDTTAEHIAHEMERRRIRHMPVVREGKLVGLVTRAHLLRAALTPAEPRISNAPDIEILSAVRRRMRAEPWCDVHFTFVGVRDGVVTFSGLAGSEDIRRGLRVLAEEVPGVQEVRFETMRTPPFWLHGP